MRKIIQTLMLAAAVLTPTIGHAASGHHVPGNDDSWAIVFATCFDADGRCLKERPYMGPFADKTHCELGLREFRKGIIATARFSKHPDYADSAADYKCEKEE